jgi:hypothetical protein
MAKPQLKRLVAGFQQRHPLFDYRSSDVGFVVDNVKLEWVSDEYFGLAIQEFLSIL